MMIQSSSRHYSGDKQEMKHIHKKGVHVWVSWILLIAFALLLSTMMYNWIYGFSEKSAKELETRTYRAEGCDDVAIVIESMCQNSQTLYMNITNNKNIIIKQVIIRLYDIYDTPENKQINLTIRPGRAEEIEILKQGHLSRVELVPVSKKGSELLICNDRVAQYEPIGLCG